MGDALTKSENNRGKASAAFPLLYYPLSRRSPYAKRADCFYFSFYGSEIMVFTSVTDNSAKATQLLPEVEESMRSHR